MDPGEHAVPDVAADILTAGDDHTGISGKQSHHRFCDKLDQSSDDQAKAEGDHDGIAQGSLCTFRFSGTDILGTQGRDGGPVSYTHLCV